MTATRAQRRVVAGSRIVAPTLFREIVARELTVAGSTGLPLCASDTPGGG
jgi:hypothetical protein